MAHGLRDTGSLRFLAKATLDFDTAHEHIPVLEEGERNSASWKTPSTKTKTGGL
jgi:hypothetical protein